MLCCFCRVLDNVMMLLCCTSQCYDVILYSGRQCYDVSLEY